jgi:hypothetical protein
MEIRKFKIAYDLELIPASHGGITRGDLVWDPIFGLPDFTRKGMPNNIFTAFLDAGLITEDEWTTMREESRQALFIEVHLASRTLDELKHPKLGKITGEFITEKVSKFTFGKLMVRTFNG